MARAELPTSTSREMALGFWVLLVINSLVIWLANMIFPSLVVLGNANSSLWWSIFHSMVLLSILGTLAVPLFEWKQEMLGRPLSMKEWMLGYLAINFAGLWLISRFSEQFGLGVAAWWVVLVLAAALDFAQGLGMMLVYKKK